jgi:hypothetical protein
MVAAAASPGAEAYWRGRAAVAQTAVADAEQHLEQLEAEAARSDSQAADGANGPCAQAASEKPAANRPAGKRACDVEVMRERQSHELQSAVEDARKQVDAARKAQDGLAAEARRAGAPPAWLH